MIRRLRFEIQQDISPFYGANDIHVLIYDYVCQGFKGESSPCILSRLWKNNSSNSPLVQHMKTSWQSAWQSNPFNPPTFSSMNLNPCHNARQTGALTDRTSEAGLRIICRLNNCMVPVKIILESEVEEQPLVLSREIPTIPLLQIVCIWFGTFEIPTDFLAKIILLQELH